MKGSRVFMASQDHPGFSPSMNSSSTNVYLLWGRTCRLQSCDFVTNIRLHFFVVPVLRQVVCGSHLRNCLSLSRTLMSVEKEFYFCPESCLMCRLENLGTVEDGAQKSYPMAWIWSLVPCGAKKSYYSII
jgi:hypothetical protein